MNTGVSTHDDKPLRPNLPLLPGPPGQAPLTAKPIPFNIMDGKTKIWETVRTWFGGKIWETVRTWIWHLQCSRKSDFEAKFVKQHHEASNVEISCRNNLF